MMKRIFYFFLTIALFVACSDDEQFSTSLGDVLTLPGDSLKMDTVFSGQASATHAFWVHNRHSQALRLNSIRLKNGSKGFRVNVDGEFLNPSATNVEVLGNDSMLVFVELTAPSTGKQAPQAVDDDLVFTFESGAEQSIALRAWSWDAERWDDKTVTADEVVTTDKPVLVFGKLTIAEHAKLRLEGVTLYFHEDAMLEVSGTLEADESTFRGDRLDRMFDYLPYDHISGQWQGVRVKAGGKVTMTGCDIHAAIVGLSADAGSIVQLTGTVVHNHAGDGIYASSAEVVLDHCQLSNAEGSLLSTLNSNVSLLHCTLAQYYPFALRDVALVLGEGTTYTVEKLLLAGYEEVLIATYEGVEPMKEEDYHVAKKEDFVLIDEENLIYDFHLNPDTESAGFGCYD